MRILQSIDRIVGTSLDRAAHGEVDIQVSLAGGALEIDPFEIVTELARLGAAGSVALGGEIDLKVRVGVPRDLFARDGVSTDVLDLLTDREQWLTIPLQVTGTIESPRFGPDMDVVEEKTKYLAEQARDSLRRRARSELSGVAGRMLVRD